MKLEMANVCVFACGRYVDKLVDGASAQPNKENEKFDFYARGIVIERFCCIRNEIQIMIEKDWNLG